TGAIIDAVFGSPAERAGISPGMKLVSVNGRKFSAEVITDALSESTKTAMPIRLEVDNAGYDSTYTIDYHGGERYPHLERDASRADVLTEIIKARAARP